MSAPSTKTPSNDRDAAPGRLYAFVITALAIFLAGVALWRTPVTGYLATAELAALTNSETDSPADDVPDMAAADSLRERLLHESGAQALLAPSSANIGPDQIAELSQRLQVQSHSASNENVVAVSFRGATRQQAIEIANRAAERSIELLSSNGPGPIDETARRQARWQADEARHYEERHRQELDNFVENNLLALTSSSSEPQQRADAGNVEQVSTAAVSLPAEQINPQWQAANDRLQALVQKREEMLVRRHAAHPEVRQLEWDIEAAKLRLAQIPKLEQTSTNETAPNDVAPTGAAEEVATTAAGGQSADPKLLARFHELRAEYEKAVEKRKLAEEAEFVELQPGATTAASTHAWVLRPATDALRSGGTPSQFQVLVLGIAAVIGGGVVSIAAGANRAVRVFTSVEQIEATLALPVVGRLFDPAMVSANTAGSRSGFGRRAVKTCEIAIAILLVMFFVSSLGAPTAAQEFTTDPLGAFSQSIVRIASWGR